VKTKEQKVSQIEKARAFVRESASILFVDFTGMNGGEVSALKTRLREMGATMSVVTKRLMHIALRREGVEFDPHTRFEGQAATIYSPQDIANTANLVYGVSQTLEKLTLLGGLDLATKAPIGQEQVLALGKLPSRQVLLGQVVGSIGSPLAGLIQVLIGRKEQLTT
jgi:large subunit ribosomal protein L10